MIDGKLIHKSLKKMPYSGSYHGMRYYLTVEDDVLKTYVYPEPFCFEKTPEEQKIFKEIPYDDTAADAAVEWLEVLYEECRSEWEEAERNQFRF